MKIIAKIPKTDSIQELANFWDTHDLTDFEDELEKVSEKVFERQTEIKIQLQSEDIEAIKALAKAKGISYDALIREWVLEKIPYKLSLFVNQKVFGGIKAWIK